MNDFSHAELRISLNGNADRVHMTWRGRSAAGNPGFRLNPYLNDLADELAGRKLLVSFQKLEYMNSSTVSPVIQFVKNLNDRGIRTRITYDGRSKWQSASFKALGGLAIMLKHISVEAI